MKACYNGMQEEENVVSTQVVGYSFATFTAIVDEDPGHINRAEIKCKKGQ